MNSTSSPTPPKPVLVFALHALVLSLLLGYWPTPRQVYPAALRAQAEWVYGPATDPVVELRAAPESAGAVTDTWMEAYAANDDEPLWRIAFSAIRMGYWPSAVLVALLLATPMTAKRRLAASAIGLAWVHVVALGRIGIEILRASEELLARGTGSETRALIAARSASEVLNSNIVVIAVVLIGWAVVAAPRRHLDLGGLLRLLGIERRPAT